ncbi:MurR/RpiR family transcriptional regulator [Trinickia symbiotica]|uniref:MurR/RpiR family transcriptional regulator n=1 Tax=Trinickia symbiotica TaxID=863227 RepID=UPI00038141B1|nr:MurR/RpiR family transcriptional regulator [Trinickia symbiotica]
MHNQTAAAAFPDAIRLRFDSLTRAQQALASYIVDHVEQAAFMTARQLGDAVGQSDAAVVRFARAIGYPGFPQMRSALREGLLERVGAGGMRAAADRPAAGEELKNEVFSSDAALLDATARLNPVPLGERVADRLIAARRIWVTAHGTTYPLALLLSMQLNQILGTCETLTVGHGDIADRIRQVGEQDVVIGIGYARYLPYTIELMKIARQYGAYIVAITDKPSSPLAQIAAESFLVGREGTLFSWWSQAGTLGLVNWLVALTATRNGENATAMLQRSDDAWRLLSHWNAGGSNGDAPSLADQLNGRLNFGRSQGEAAASEAENLASPTSGNKQASRRRKAR